MNSITQWALDTHHLGRLVYVYDRVASTNALAMTLAEDPGNQGLAVLAWEQTAGRGRDGRAWQAPAGSSVLLSVLLFPPETLRRPAILTAWATVSVCETIRELTGLPARIKWPNDVLLEGRKAAGILVERGRGTAVGIGLNVRQAAADFTAGGLPDATSLLAATGCEFEPDNVARRLLMKLDEEYDRLLGGDLTALEKRWSAGLGLEGKSVVAECADGSHSGRLVGLTFAGVELERPGAARLVLVPERVLHLS